MLGALDEVARGAVTSSGYAGLVAIMVLENLFPPIPSEIVLPFAGYEVSQGNLSLVATIAAATLGALIGALILYSVGRFGGRPAVVRWGRVLRVGPAEIRHAERWFERWGDWVVLGARLVPGARSVVSIPAGMAPMPLWRFVALTTIGSAIWNTVLIVIGQQLGNNWDAISEAIGGTGRVAVIALAIGVAGLLVANWVRRRGSVSG